MLYIHHVSVIHTNLNNTISAISSGDILDYGVRELSAIMLNHIIYVFAGFKSSTKDTMQYTDLRLYVLLYFI